MSKNPIKTALKRFVIKTRNYIDSLEEEPRQNHNYDQYDTAYPWLNDVCRKLFNEGAGAWRPHFIFGVLHGAYLAKMIGIPRVSVIEFGVAGGNGLISLERVAEKVEGILGVNIDVYGFDTGAGLPKPRDHRDSPNSYTENSFIMDAEKLKKRLNRARLLLGLVDKTILEFNKSNPAPVAFISFDLDYYSSTMHAFKLFDADPRLLLPRVHCYFDDIVGFTHSDFTGERLAITEFNASHPMRKISPIYGLRYFLSGRLNEGAWPDMFYLAHIFDHELYGVSDGLWKRPFGSSTDLRS